MKKFFVLIMICVGVLHGAGRAPIEYACWRDLDDDARTLLLGECWMRCDYDISTQQGLEWLWKETERRLEKEGMTPLRMALAVKGICSAYIERTIEEGKFPNGWVKSPQDFYNLAADFFPDDQNMQAICALYTMAYYTECAQRRRRSPNMFVHPERPVKEEWLGERYFMLDTEVMCLFTSGVSTQILYLLQKDYNFSFLDFFVSMSKQWQLAVMLTDWTSTLSAHSGNVKGVFQLLFHHDDVHGCMATYFDVVMDTIDRKFAERKGPVSESVLKKWWSCKGPEMLGGGFFLFHEGSGSIIDSPIATIYNESSPMDKMEQLLLDGSRREVTDKGMYGVVASIFPKERMSQKDKDQRIQAISRTFAKEFIKQYRELPIERKVNPKQDVSREWLGSYEGELPNILQAACAYASCRKGVPYVRIAGGYGPYPRPYIPLSRAGYVNFSIPMDQRLPDLLTTLVPTKMVVDSYTPQQAKQMVEAFEVYDRYHVEYYLTSKVSDLSLSTNNLFVSFPDHIKEKMFGADWRSLKRTVYRKVPGVVFFAEAANMQRDRLEAFSLSDQQRKFLDRMMCKLRNKYDDRGSLAFIILVDVYMQSKKEGRDDAIKELFEGGTASYLPYVDDYYVEKGKTLLDKLCEWHHNIISSYCFVVSELSLFDRVCLEAKNMYPIYFLEGDVYKQCLTVHNRAANEALCCHFLYKDGLRENSPMSKWRKGIGHRLLECWDSVGLLYLIGVDLLRENVVFEQPLVRTAYSSNTWKYLLSLAIKRSVVGTHAVLEAILTQHPQLRSSIPDYPLEHQLMYLATSEGLVGFL